MKKYENMRSWKDVFFFFYYHYFSAACVSSIYLYVINLHVASFWHDLGLGMYWYITPQDSKKIQPTNTTSSRRQLWLDKATQGYKALPSKRGNEKTSSCRLSGSFPVSSGFSTSLSSWQTKNAKKQNAITISKKGTCAATFTFCAASWQALNTPWGIPWSEYVWIILWRYVSQIP